MFIFVFGSKKHQSFTVFQSLQQLYTNNKKLKRVKSVTLLEIATLKNNRTYINLTIILV